MSVWKWHFLSHKWTAHNHRYMQASFAISTTWNSREIKSRRVWMALHWGNPWLWDAKQFHDEQCKIFPGWSSELWNIYRQWSSETSLPLRIQCDRENINAGRRRAWGVRNSVSLLTTIWPFFWVISPLVFFPVIIRLLIQRKPLHSRCWLRSCVIDYEHNGLRTDIIQYASGRPMHWCPIPWFLVMVDSAVPYTSAETAQRRLMRQLSVLCPRNRTDPCSLLLNCRSLQKLAADIKYKGLPSARTKTPHTVCTVVTIQCFNKHKIRACKNTWWPRPCAHP